MRFQAISRRNEIHKVKNGRGFQNSRLGKSQHQKNPSTEEVEGIPASEAGISSLMGTGGRQASNPAAYLLLMIYMAARAPKTIPAAVPTTI